MGGPARTPVEHMVGWLEGYRAAHHITHPGRLTTDELKALHDHLLAEVATLPEAYALPPGTTGLTLYSGPVGPGLEEQSWVVAEAMSRATAGRQGYFADTVAGQVLNNRGVQDALRRVVRHDASYDVLMSGRAGGEDRHVYGDHRLAVWDEVSRSFVRANPDLPVTAVVPAARRASVFARTEAGAYLEHNQGQPMNGRSHAQWDAAYDQGVARGMNHEQAQTQVAGTVVGECATALRGVPVHELVGGEQLVDVGPLVGQQAQVPPGTVRTTTLGERLDALRAGTAPAPPVAPSAVPTAATTPSTTVPAPAAVTRSSLTSVPTTTGTGPTPPHTTASTTPRPWRPTPAPRVPGFGHGVPGFGRRTTGRSR